MFAAKPNGCLESSAKLSDHVRAQQRWNSTRNSNQNNVEQQLKLTKLERDEDYPHCHSETKTTNTKRNIIQLQVASRFQRQHSSNQSHSINSLSLSLLLLYSFISMSLFYQVMGANRCPKIKKHAGIKLRPINKAKEPFMPNDMLIFSCESAEFTQSIKCLDDGRWSEVPHCPDPSNFTCPDLAPIKNGAHNVTSAGPYKVGTVVAYRCDNELLPGRVGQLFNLINTSSGVSNIASSEKNSYNIIRNNSNASTLSSSSEDLNVGTSDISHLKQASTTTPKPVIPLRYNLTGYRILKCLPSAKWNHPQPNCLPVLPEPTSNVSVLVTSLFVTLIPILILVTIIQLFLRWRRRQQQRERWKQYFTDYKYRHSKTSITFGSRGPQNHHQHDNNQNSATNNIPVTDL